MRRTLAALCMSALLSGTAHAHIAANLPRPIWPTISKKMRHRVAEVTHNVWPGKRGMRMAHWTQRLFACESQWRWWLRGTYWGLLQADENFRNSYSETSWTDDVTIKEQVITTRNGYNARGGQPWPNCP